MLFPTSVPALIPSHFSSYPHLPMGAIMGHELTHDFLPHHCFSAARLPSNAFLHACVHLARPQLRWRPDALPFSPDHDLHFQCPTHHKWAWVWPVGSNSLGFPKPAGPRPETRLAGYKPKVGINRLSLLCILFCIFCILVTSSNVFALHCISDILFDILNILFDILFDIFCILNLVTYCYILCILLCILGELPVHHRLQSAAPQQIEARGSGQCWKRRIRMRQ